jgi:hypothetical protein
MGELTPAQQLRFTAAAERALRVRREILLLAGFACGHLPGGYRTCRACRKNWPCPETLEAATSALDAVADLRG